ncbi:MAG: hypothetical protein KKH08_02250 [Candidatus Omnitrophica bacterium]|nr:hypothetical protein [Candidatus Omnitrophota bacterium]
MRKINKIINIAVVIFLIFCTILHADNIKEESCLRPSIGKQKTYADITERMKLNSDIIFSNIFAEQEFLGDLNSEAFSILRTIYGKRRGDLPEEMFLEHRDYLLSTFGEIKPFPDLYDVNCYKILFLKIQALEAYFDKIVIHLNKLEPYDELNAKYNVTQKRSGDFKDGYNNNRVSWKLSESINNLKEKKYKFLEIPFIFLNSWDYAFGFNTEGYNDEDINLMFDAPTIALCKELKGYLLYLDEVNKGKGINTNIFLECITYLALRDSFTHEEASILIQALFPENYTKSVDSDKASGLLYKALKDLRTVEIAIGYLTRPRRSSWPHDRHYAFQEIGSAVMSREVLKYAPFYKRLLRAMLLFSFTPDHSDLAVYDGYIGGFLYSLNATDDLALATLWALDNPNNFDKSKSVQPYTNLELEGKHYYVASLIARRNQNIVEDKEKHFTHSEKIEILLTSLRYCRESNWDFYSSEEFEFIPIKLLPYLPDLTDEDMKLILNELADIVDETIKKSLYKHTAEFRRLSIILKAIENFIEIRPEISLPAKLVNSINLISRDKILQDNELTEIIQVDSNDEMQKNTGEDILSKVKKHRNFLIQL